jgi:hypothetical protein
MGEEETEKQSGDRKSDLDEIASHCVSGGSQPSERQDGFIHK